MGKKIRFCHVCKARLKELSAKEKTETCVNPRCQVYHVVFGIPNTENQLKSVPKWYAEAKSRVKKEQCSVVEILQRDEAKEKAKKKESLQSSVPVLDQMVDEVKE